MPIELKIPEIGESITEVQVGEWLKAEGDAVQKDDPLVVIESEKTTLELPAPESGRLSKILHARGDTVAVGDIIGQLEAEAGAAAAPKPSGSPPARKAMAQGRPAEPRPPEGEQAPNVAKPKTEAPAGKPANRVRADAGGDKPAASNARGPSEPRSRRPADGGEMVAATPDLEQKRVDRPSEPEPAKAAEDTEGAEPASSETKVERETKPAPARPASSAAAHEAPSPGADGNDEVVPMSLLRRTAARRLVEAKQQMAMLTTFNEVDLSAVQGLRQEHRATFEERYQVKLGLMSFFVKAAIEALKRFPQLNAEVRGNDIVYHHSFNIGVAIATRRGLVVPVLRHTERLSFADVERGIDDFARRAHEGKLKPEELQGATFTITNGGVFGSLLSTPIINPPQAGILGMHSIQERPIAWQGQVVIRPMMYLALTYDHRIVDGREAVLFTRRIKETIESPARLLLEV